MAQSEQKEQGKTVAGASSVKLAEKEAKIRAWYEKKPSVMEANTYYWGGFWGNGSARIKRANSYAEEVESWLLDVFDDAEVKREENKVYLQGYMVFWIDSSRKNVYRSQDLPFIKRAVKEKTGVNLNARKRVKA